jgi:hypothetical protein
MMQVVNEHLKFYGDPKESPQYEEILLDVDHHYFINYLIGLLDDDYEIHVEKLKIHKHRIEYQDFVNFQSVR